MSSVSLSEVYDKTKAVPRPNKKTVKTNTVKKNENKKK